MRKDGQKSGMESNADTGPADCADTGAAETACAAPLDDAAPRVAGAERDQRDANGTIGRVAGKGYGGWSAKRTGVLR